MLDTKISDMLAAVKFNLGNRSNIDSNIYTWIRDAYREIGNNYPLETLEATGNDTMVVGQTKYAYPDDARAMKSVSILADVTNLASPIELVMRDIKYVQRYPTNFNGLPSLWAPFNRVMHVRLPPQDVYPMTLRYWQFVVIDSTVENTILLVPDDWLEIIQYEATRRGYIALKQYTDAQQLHMLLHGDPKNPGDPGLITRKLTQNAAENSISDYAIAPRIRKYSY